jgi:acyl-CoA synthetase (NDP forming)
VARQNGVGLLTGIRQGLGAVAALAKSAIVKQRRPACPLPGMRVGDLGPNVAARPSINEVDAKRVLGSNGVTIACEIVVGTLAEAGKAASEIGYPVVLKVVSDDIPHKSELGLVAVNITNEDELRKAWNRMQATLPGRGPVEFVVQEFVHGFELFAGVTQDADLGPFLAFGFGGVDIEELKEFVLRPLPLRQGDAEEMIAEIRDGNLLRPGRNRPAVNVEMLADRLYALSDFATAEADIVSAIDLNPLIVVKDGTYRCVDALIITRQAKAAQ